MGKVQVDAAQEATARLLSMFEEGNLPESIAETLIRRQQSEAPSAKWSLSNQLLMILSGTQDARGYKQWEKVGRKVKPRDERERDVFILAPLKGKRKDEDTGEEKIFIYGFKGVRMYRLEDTEGEEIVEPDYTPMQLPPLWERAQEMGVSVDYRPFVGGFRGFYSPHADAICLVTHDTRTFWHELAHAAHARVETLKGGQDSRQEIIAETVAAVLCVMYGCEGYVAKSHDYIRGYCKGHKNPTCAIMSVLKTVQQVLDVILKGDEE